MKRFIRNNIKIILGIIIGLVASSMAVYAVTIVNASQVIYQGETVEEALDDLYNKVDEVKSIKKFCQLKSGKKETVGAKYECDPGDGEKRIFYILSVNKNTVDLIMEHNITSGNMTWNDAMKYFRSGEGLAVKTSWINVMNVDLPKVQAIADATGNDWIASDSEATWWCLGSKKMDTAEFPYCTNTNQETYAWLFNHLIGCTASGCTDDRDATSSGYWTQDLIFNTDFNWIVAWSGRLLTGLVSDSLSTGIRPVITVLKSNLFES